MTYHLVPNLAGMMDLVFSKGKSRVEVSGNAIHTEEALRFSCIRVSSS